MKRSFKYLTLLSVLIWILLSGCSSRAGQKNNPEKTLSQIPQRNIKTLLVLGFGTQSEDGLLWGPYCSRILQDKIQFAPHEIISIPSPNLIDGFYKTSQYPREKYMDTNEEMEGYFSQAYGIDPILTGKIIQKGDTIRFLGAIRFQSGKDKPIPVEVDGSVSNPSEFMTRLALAVLIELKVPLNDTQKEYLNKANSGSAEAFKLGAQAFTKSSFEDKQALDLYSKAMSMDSTFIFAALGACERMIQNDPRHALNFIEDVRMQHPENPSFSILEMYYLGIQNSDTTKMLQLAQEVLKDNPENCMGMAYTIYGQGKLNHLDEAEKMSEKFLETYPENWYAHSLHQWILQRRGLQARGGNYSDQMTRQQKYEFVRYLRLALEESILCVKLHPRSLQRWGVLMEDLMETGGSDADIERAFSRATTINPHQCYPWTVILWNYRPGYSNQPERVRDLMAEAMRLNPDDHEFALLVLKNIDWYIYNKFSAEAHRYLISDTTTLNSAIHCMMEYAKANPDDEKTLLDVINYLEHAHLKGKPWEFYKLMKDPPDQLKHKPSMYYQFKARAAFDANEPKAAVHYADLCLASSPSSGDASNAYMIKALEIFSRSPDEQGFQYLSKAIQIEPRNLFAYKTYAKYAGEANQHVSEGFGYIQKAIQADSQNAWNYAFQAKLYACKKDKVNGMKSIDEAIRRDPKVPEFQKIKNEIMALP